MSDVCNHIVLLVCEDSTDFCTVILSPAKLPYESCRVAKLSVWEAAPAVVTALLPVSLLDAPARWPGAQMAEAMPGCGSQPCPSPAAQPSARLGHDMRSRRPELWDARSE